MSFIKLSASFIIGVVNASSYFPAYLPVHDLHDHMATLIRAFQPPEGTRWANETDSESVEMLGVLTQFATEQALPQIRSIIDTLPITQGDLVLSGVRNDLTNVARELDTFVGEPSQGAIPGMWLAVNNGLVDALWKLKPVGLSGRYHVWLQSGFRVFPKENPGDASISSADSEIISP